MVKPTQQHVQDVHSVRSHFGLCFHGQLGLLEVSGEDAAGYLQTQSSNDVFSLEIGQGQLSSLLDRKAHVQSIFTLYRLAENKFWLLLDKHQLAATLHRLESFHFTESVVFQSKQDDLYIYGLHGPESWAMVQQVSPDWVHPQQEFSVILAPSLSQDVTILKKSLTGEEGYLFVFSQEAPSILNELQTLTTLHKGAQLTPETMDILRIEAGWPLYGIDVTEAFILPQTGLERFAVSYSKGCYIGQEVVAKVKTYGSVQYAMVGLVFDDAVSLPNPGTPIFFEDKEVGTLFSHTISPTLGEKTIALALLQRDYRLPQNRLQLSMADVTYAVEVSFLPFYQAHSASQRAQEKYDKALGFFAADETEPAITLLREAIALHPQFNDAYEALGVILSKNQAYDEAIHLMQKLAELDPDNVMAHSNLSVFYMQLGMKEEAEAEKDKATVLGFRKAIADNQTKQSQEQALLDKHQQLEEKIAMFEEVLALDSEDALASYGLGSALLELNRAEEAVQHLEKSVLLDPRYSVAYLALGRCYDSLKNIQKARSTFKNGIEVSAKRGDLMPMQEMQRALDNLSL
jgi:folate-binding protein YgfZ